MLLLICLMSKGGKESIKGAVRVWSWGVIEVLYGNQVTGRRAHWLTMLLGNQILRVSVFLSTATFRESLLFLLFFITVWGKLKDFFFSFMFYLQRILWLWIRKHSPCWKRESVYLTLTCTALPSIYRKSKHSSLLLQNDLLSLAF